MSSIPLYPSWVNYVQFFPILSSQDKDISILSIDKLEVVPIINLLGESIDMVVKPIPTSDRGHISSAHN